MCFDGFRRAGSSHAEMWRVWRAGLARRARSARSCGGPMSRASPTIVSSRPAAAPEDLVAPANEGRPPDVRRPPFDVVASWGSTPDAGTGADGLVRLTAYGLRLTA